MRPVAHAALVLVVLAVAVACARQGTRKLPGMVRNAPTTATQPQSGASQRTTANGEPSAPDAARREPSPERPAVDFATLRARPGRILGQGPDRVQALLGPPARIRTEPPARIWQYRVRTCVLDVFLYAKDGTRRATHIEARDRSARPMSPARCLKAVVAAGLEPTG